VAKLCNNLLLGITMGAVCEAMQLGTRLGVDAKVLAQVINSSSGRSWSSDTYNPCPQVEMAGVPSTRNYEGGFACDLMLKDLGLAQQAAASCNLPLPLGSSVQTLYSEVSKRGLGKKDFSSIYLLPCEPAT
jgi:3-hydroxyisobutyrate dehydrogenase